MAVFYKDLDKYARGIINDEYSLKRTLKVKHTTPNGLTVTTKNDHSKAVTAAVEAKYFDPKTAISVDKLSLLCDGSLGVEASKVVSKELVLRTKLDDSMKGEVTADYVSKGTASSVSVDTEGTWARASTCVTASGIRVGGSVDAGLNGKSSTLQSYSVGAATGGARWGASLTCINRLQTYNASGYYLINDKVIGSVLASCTPEKSQNSFEAGVKYACNPTTVVRAKVNSAGVLTACATQKCTDGVLVTATTQVTKADRSPRFGIMCTLG